MKKYIVTGLIILLPILITFYIVSLILNILTGPFEKGVAFLLQYTGIIQNGWGFLSRGQTIEGISKLLILIGLFFFITLVGMCTPVRFIRSIYFRLEDFIERIPFINTLYNVCKEFIQTCLSPHVSQYNLPALVPYFSEEEKGMGIVMNEFKSDILGKKDQEFSAVLIPCTPNITTAVLCLYAKEDVEYLDMPIQDAVSFIIAFANVDKKKV